MYIPDKFLLWVVKAMIFFAVFSLSMSLLNLVPFYVQLNHVANELAMMSAVNNYVLKREVKSVVEDRFGADTLMGGLISQKDKRLGDSSNRYGNGVYVYGRVSSDPGKVFPENANCRKGYGCGSYTPSNGRTLIFNRDKFNPKRQVGSSGVWSGDSDFEHFRASKGAQRGDTVGIRVESKMRGVVFLIGVEAEFEIPLVVEKTLPAMYYYPDLYEI